MPPLIKRHLDELVGLCRQYGVPCLDVFGSAATEAFDPARSDVDFLVEFEPEYDLGPRLSQYFEFRAALEELLGRSVDLVMAGAPRNPYFVREAARTRTLLYASEVA